MEGTSAPASREVCFFGIFDPAYARNRILRRGFEENGYTVVECRADPRMFPGGRKFIELIRQWRRIKDRRFAYVIVCFPGQSVVWLARLLFGRRIIFDALVSLYDSNVGDRRRYGPYSPGALRDRFYDWYSVRLSARVLMDTDAHCDYLARFTGAAPSKFIRVFLTSDPAIFDPNLARVPVPHEGVVVEFHGTFIPLHGIDTMLDAAYALRDRAIHFRFIGSGQEHGRVIARAHMLGLTNNVTFLPRMPIESIRDEIAAADICLGNFGVTARAGRAISNKVYEAFAMGKPVITRDSLAARELLEDGVTALLTPPGDGAALAAAIRRLSDDPGLRSGLGRNGRALYLERLTPKRLVAELCAALPAP